MSGTFTAIDLSQLAAPTVVEQISYETALAEMLADLQERDATFSALVESDPAYKVLEVAAYRETLIRQTSNEKCLAVMLAYASGSDLDQIGATFNVERLVITEANTAVVPPIEAVYESDNDFRARIQLSFEGYTTAGSKGSYIFHGKSADADVKDIDAVSPTPGNVTVYVLARSGNGIAGEELITTVSSALNGDDIRPMTDNVTVQSASIVNYSIVAELVILPGPDSSVVLQAALAAITAYTASQHMIGYDVPLSGIYKALHQSGVQRVNLTSPSANVVITDGEAPYCTGITVTVASATDV